MLLVFAESYGAVALDDPALAEALGPWRERLADTLAAGGRGVVSARVRSPTFGGGSWLAHAALLSGIDTSDPLRYEQLLASDRPTLVSLFARHGWRSVGWMPGLQRPWPEGRFFAFDRLAGTGDLGYRGPAFGYWQVPDQASMALLQAQELPPRDGEGRAPRFIVFPTLATHAPFRPLPPYRNDWAGVLRPDAWTADEVARAEARPAAWSGPTAHAAYLEALRYQFDWWRGWFAGPAPRRMLVILVGDHQPVAAISGVGAGHEVPVHVISDDASLLARFEQRGFVPGLGPMLPSLGAMHELTGLLAEVFDPLSPAPHP